MIHIFEATPHKTRLTALHADFPSYCPEKNKAAVLSASRGSDFFAKMRQKSTKYTILI